jgi:diaminopimelate epimerase
VVAGIRRGLLDPRVDVQTRGGMLTLEWRGGPVLMTGPAEPVFTGEIDVDALHLPNAAPWVRPDLDPAA